MVEFTTRSAICWTAIAVLVIVCGCGDGRVEVTGRVTLDGKPIEAGSIEFVPVKGAGPTAGAVIADGRYTMLAATGKKRVRIVGYRKVGTHHAIAGDPNSPIVAKNESILPAKFNARTQLTATIDGSTSDLNFELRLDAR